jgi:hypothetical protein
VKHLNLNPKEFCSSTDACREGREFAEKYNTMAEVWDACPKADWLLWILRAIDAPANDKGQLLFSIWCARSTPMHGGRTTSVLLTDPRSIEALEVAERFAHGNATKEELAAACDAAWDAARAAAGDAAWDAACDAARDAAGAAAGDAAGAAQANQLRKMISNPFKGGRK